MKIDTVVQQANKLSVASIYEAAKQSGALPSSIKPLSPSFKLIGRAYPVKSPPADNLWIHRAIYAASPGDVLVIDANGYGEAGHWGDILATAAMNRGIVGLVIYGGVRDSQELIKMEFPVFSKGICIRGTTKDPNGHGSLGDVIKINDVVIKQGDIVVGDADGVVIVPKERETEIIQKALEREKYEEDVCKRLTLGETTLSIYNL
jgi:4-hydroxy-4-methyl-2-oxoglutarate aldolase